MDIFQKMRADQYVTKIVTAKTAPHRMFLTTHVQPVINIVSNWGGNFLRQTKFSGSHAKNTAILGSNDVDIFISLKDTTPAETKMGLREIYESLAEYMGKNKYIIKKQNVSIGITHGGFKIDLVPAVHQGGLLSSDHSIYRRKQNTWAKTNIDTHINHVLASGRGFDIRAVKIWKDIHHLEFPSFYLELVVLEALKGKSLNDPSGNLYRVFEFLASDFQTKVFFDPANTNNKISDELTINEKKLIADMAHKHRYNTQYWEHILW